MLYISYKASLVTTKERLTVCVLLVLLFEPHIHAS